MVSTKHKIALVIDVSGLTIRGLGTSMKLAPLILAPTETAPKTKVSNADSKSVVIARFDEGCATNIPRILQINVAMPDQMRACDLIVERSRLYANQERKLAISVPWMPTLSSS